MIRILSALSCALLCVAATSKAADTMIHRAGEWELNGTSTTMGSMSQKVCLKKDEPAAETEGPQGCQKPNVVTGSGTITIDDVCSGPRGGKMTVHVVVTATGPDADRTETHTHTDGAPQGAPPDETTVITARRLGPCQPGDQPGD